MPRGEVLMEKGRREDACLEQLKEQLQYTSADVAAANKGELSFCNDAIEGFLLRYLKAEDISVTDAISKLKRRRAFEHTLPIISVTPAVLAVLRSGAIRIIGKDARHRLVLFIDLPEINLPAFEVDEVERLAIILLEYVQAQCLSDTRSLDAADTPGKKATADVQQQQPQGATASAKKSKAETVETRYAPQCVLLINAGEGAVSGHSPFLRKTSNLHTVVSKYYPRLLSLGLVVDAPFDLRQAIRLALAGSSDDVKGCIHLVERADITRFLDRSIVPSHLGGSNTVNNGAAFSDAVLRHWFTLTSYLQLESQQQPPSRTKNENNTSTNNYVRRRPLYLPPPQLGDCQHFLSLQRRALGMSTELTTSNSTYFYDGTTTTTTDIGNGRGAAAATMSTARVNGKLEGSHNDGAAPLSQTQVSVRLGGGGDLMTTLDDGICSSLSGDEDCFFADDEGNSDAHGAAGDGALRGMNGNAAAAALIASTGAGVSEEERAMMTRDSQYAVTSLEIERARRLNAEQRLRLVECGVMLDPRNASVIEKELAAIHQEMNVLVADIVVRSNHGGEKDGGSGVAPSVQQLLDMTVSALEAVVNEPEEVPALAFAQPADRSMPEGGCCCTMM